MAIAFSRVGSVAWIVFVIIVCSCSCSSVVCCSPGSMKEEPDILVVLSVDIVGLIAMLNTATLIAAHKAV